MTFDDWKAALIPLGWVEESCGNRIYLESPLSISKRPIFLWINNVDGELTLEMINDPGDIYAPGAWKRMREQRWISFDLPPDIDTMLALMVGLQIPCTEQKERA